MNLVLDEKVFDKEDEWMVDIKSQLQCQYYLDQKDNIPATVCKSSTKVRH